MQDEHDGGLHDMESIDLKLAAMEHRDTAEGRREMTEAMMEDNAVLARAFYAAYSALVAAGFDEEQAFELIVRRGWHLAEGN